MKLSENNVKELEAFAEKLGSDAVIWAIDEAAACGKGFFAYARGILKNKLDQGARGLDDIRLMEERRHDGTDKHDRAESPSASRERWDCGEVI